MLQHLIDELGRLRLEQEVHRLQEADGVYEELLPLWHVFVERSLTFADGLAILRRGWGRA